MDQYPPTTPPAMEFSHAALDHLNETRKWALFLAILAIVAFGLMLLMMVYLIFFSPGAEFPAQGMFVFPAMLFGIALYYLPILWLFRFSESSRKAVLHHDSHMLTRAMRYLKLEFRYMGILTLIVMGLYLIGIVAGLVTRAFI